MMAETKQVCYLPRLFMPSGDHELIRLGSPNDGGYVVATSAVANTRYLLSLGLGQNCDFEWDMSRAGRVVRLHCYDHTVDAAAVRKTFIHWVANLRRRRQKHAFYPQYRALFRSGRPGFTHFRQAVGGDEGQVSLSKAMAVLGPEEGAVFLKADIDGAEYGILQQIIDNAAFFAGIAIELHEVPLHLPEISSFLTALKKFMCVDNTTANNFGGVDPDGMPNVIEVSMSMKGPPPHAVVGRGQSLLLNAPNSRKRRDLEVAYRD